MPLSDESETILLIACSVILGISTLIFIPIEVYYAYQIYDHRESLVMYVVHFNILSEFDLRSTNHLPATTDQNANQDSSCLPSSRHKSFILPHKSFSY